jgi:hypothetical protein
MLDFRYFFSLPGRIAFGSFISVDFENLNSQTKLFNNWIALLERVVFNILNFVIPINDRQAHIIKYVIIA